MVIYCYILNIKRHYQQESLSPDPSLELSTYISDRMCLYVPTIVFLYDTPRACLLILYIGKVLASGNV